MGVIKFTVSTTPAAKTGRTGRLKRRCELIVSSLGSRNLTEFCSLGAYRLILIDSQNTALEILRENMFICAVVGGNCALFGFITDSAEVNLFGCVPTASAAFVFCISSKAISCAVNVPD